MPSVIEEIRQLWKEASMTIKNEFGISTSEVPASIELIEKVQLVTLSGSARKNDRLVFSRQILERPELLRAMIYRECLLSALEPLSLCDEAKNDLANEFARQQLSPQEQEYWSREWASQVPRRQVSTVHIYDPSRAYVILYKMTGKEALHQILRAVILAAQYGGEMNFESYLTYLQTRAQRFIASLNEADVRIIEYIVNHPDSQQKEVAEAVQLTPQWVTYRLKNLREKFILRRFTYVPFSRIGIRMFNLLLGDPLMRLTSSLLQDCPFLYAYRPVFTGPWNVYATLAVPDCIENIGAVRQFVHLLRRRRFPIHIAEIVSSESILSLKYFNANARTWEIPWERLQCEAGDGEASAKIKIKRVVRSARRTQMYIGETEIRILEIVRRGMTEIEQIRSTLKIGQSRVVDRLRALRREGLLATRWEAHNIGLVECAYIIAIGRQRSESVARFLLRSVPRIYLSFDVQHELFAIVELPSGGIYRLVRALQDTYKYIISGMIEQSVYGAWGFPAHLWNTRQQTWCADQNAINTWLNSVACIIEYLEE